MERVSVFKLLEFLNIHNITQIHAPGTVGCAFIYTIVTRWFNCNVLTKAKFTQQTVLQNFRKHKSRLQDALFNYTCIYKKYCWIFNNIIIYTFPEKQSNQSGQIVNNSADHTLLNILRYCLSVKILMHHTYFLHTSIPLKRYLSSY